MSVKQFEEALFHEALMLRLYNMKKELEEIDKSADYPRA